MSDKLYGGIRAGSVDVSLVVLLLNTTDNSEKTGVAHTDVTGSYWRQGGSRTGITMASLTNLTDAHSDGGWKEVDGTNMPGIYRFDVPDAAFATGADWVIVYAKVSGAFAFKERYALETRRSLRKGQAYTGFEFLLADVLGQGVTTGTPTCERSLDGAGFAAMTNSASHVANGVWKIDLSTSDTNANIFATYKFSVTGAITRVITLILEP